MKEELQRIKAEALDAIKGLTDIQSLQDIRVKYLGKKGEVTALLKGLGKLSPEERPKAGALVNAVREALEAEIDTVKVRMETAELNARLEQERIDITLPGRAQKAGHIHPLTKVNEMIEDFFMKMGYTVEEGPEIEQDYFNFECLNLPKDHPARDMQDSFYITENFLLRTHTSPVQARTMQRHEPNSPIRMIAPGKVYRWDYDATHSPVFHQVEGLIIDEHITFADLKGTLESFLRHRVCSHTGWLEILGCGMVHPDVLRINGYDPEKVKGFAFGMGVERIAMLLYGINDLRLFFEDDVRFLEQF